MPRKPREAWEKVPNRWKWRCKVCGAEFDSTFEAARHVEEDCLPTRGCARCGAKLDGMRWQTKYCSPSCRVMDCRDRNAGKPTRRTRKQTAAKSTATAVKTRTTKTAKTKTAKTVKEWCDHCNRTQPHHQRSDGWWVCDKCGN